MVRRKSRAKKTVTRRKGQAKPKINRGTLILLGILALAAFLRFYLPTWDSSLNPNGHYSVHQCHPDERHIFGVSISVGLNNLNPKSSAYGSFPFYLLKSASVAIGQLIPSALPGRPGFYFLGRAYHKLKKIKKAATAFENACALGVKKACN